MKIRSKRNKTIISKTLKFSGNRFNIGVINGDYFDFIDQLPDRCINLLILDPPYNLSKKYGYFSFLSKSIKEYEKYFEKIISKLIFKLRSNATIYICSDWKTSNIIFPILDNHFFVKNRITWERDKGRGSKTNWKNNTEDIWYCVSNKDDYYFNVDAVKLRKKVIAPYVDDDK